MSRKILVDDNDIFKIMKEFGVTGTPPDTEINTMTGVNVARAMIALRARYEKERNEPDADRERLNNAQIEYELLRERYLALLTNAIAYSEKQGLDDSDLRQMYKELSGEEFA